MSPLVDVANPASPPSASLHTPFLYELFAPVSNVLDTITTLTPAQYWATYALCALCFFAATLLRQRRAVGRFSLAWTARSTLAFLAGTVAVIGVMLIAPRPMASLSLRDPDLIAVDFHSHTEASHDGRAGFNAERNREWHHSSGFDAVYVTDHQTFDGALDGEARNPALAGGGTVLLPGVELRHGAEHLLLIGVDPRRMKITSPDWKGAAVAADGGAVPAMLFFSIPGDISRIAPDNFTGAVRLAGIEASDGCPRGLAQAATERDSILSIARRHSLAIIAGSDNHGWGRASAAWSVLTIPGWREMSPRQLDVEIRRAILERGTRAIQIVSRRSAPAAHNRVEAALAGLAVGTVMARTMSWSERLSWSAWSWVICLLSLRLARTNRARLRAIKRARTKKPMPPRFIDEAAIRKAS
ncbi:MAG TPA: hypothetical protein VD771_04820 [Gemmatimonadaceae bacterium]|nr:hypothetical protein [Gemmatimonadaceae bacterium]